MRGFYYRCTLLLESCLAGHSCLAQQTPITSFQPSQPTLVVPMRSIALTPQASTAALAPAQSVALPVTGPAPGPLLLLNSRLVIGYNVFAKINPHDIESLRVYKEPDTTPAPWGTLLRYGHYSTLTGIIDMTLKKPLRLPSQRLAQLGHRLHVKHAAYLLNGTTVTDTKLRIAKAAIKEVTVTYTPGGAVIKVQLFTQADMPSTPHPPGTIMIRGTASR